MSDLIDRQAAIDALYKMLHDCFWADDEELDAVITTINDLPSAQPEPLKITIDPAQIADQLERIKHAMRNIPVMLLPSVQPEIIRCRDCKYYDEVNQPYPQMYCRKHSIDTSDQDFCSRAERKDDE